MEESVPSFFRFEDLRVYGKAVDYCRWLHVAMRESRTENEKNISNHFLDSAMSIAMNIAEGSSRSRNQFEACLKNAKTSIRECVVYTTVANGLGMMNDDSAEQSRGYLMELTRMIGALIISLQRNGQRKSPYDTDSQPESDFEIKVPEERDGDDFVN